MVRLGVGDDGLDGHDGLVDLGLQLSQLLDVQQAQDLSRLVQGRVWGEMHLLEWPRCLRVTLIVWVQIKPSLTSSVETQGVFVQRDRDTLR